jgi:pimeloyl-ACP methyl ester carboxylesterase
MNLSAPPTQATTRRPVRWLRAGIFGALGLVLLIILSAGTYEWYSERQDDAAYPAPGRMIDMGGYRLHLNCTGTGSPTVILESGYFLPAVIWNTVQPKIAKFAQVCSYDRGGYGWSDPSPRPRTQSEIARELHELLSKGGISGPVVLVGHSFGGLVVQRFAEQFPQEVAGLVLVESSASNEAMPSITGRDRYKNWESKWLTNLGIIRTRKSRGPVGGVESRLHLSNAQANAYQSWHFRAKCYSATFDEWDASFRELGKPVHLGSVPVTVLAAEKEDGPGSLNKQQALAALSTHGEFRVVKNSDHFIGLDQPAAVAGAAFEFVQAQRQSGTMALRSAN